MHLSAAVGTRCVALFSGHNPVGRWEPPGEHVIVRESVTCAPCGKVACPLEDHPCMTRITVERVWRGVVEALG